MSVKATSKMSVAVEDGLVCVKIEGRANFASSVSFKDLVNGLREKQHHRFLLDLTDCQNMDSTFLGVIAGIGMDFEKSANTSDADTMELLNPNERISDLLDNLDIEHLFKVVEGPNPLLGELENVENKDTSKVDMTRNCLEAHQTLMKVSESNVAKFKDVARFFAEDLKRMGG